MAIKNKSLIKCLILFVAIFVCVGSFTTIAAEIKTNRADVDLSNETLYVDGILENGWINRPISLMVLYPRVDISNIRNVDIAGVRQTLSQQNGTASPTFSFKPYQMQDVAPSGEYKLLIRAYGFMDVIKSFSYKGADAIYQGLNGIIAGASLNEAIADNANNLSIDGSRYQSLTTNAKTLIDPFLVSKISTFSLANYSDFATNSVSARAIKAIAVEFRNYYDEMIIIGQFSDAQNAVSVEGWMRDNSSRLQLNQNAEIYRIFQSDMNAEQKNDVLLKLSDVNNLTSIGTIRQAFYKQTLLSGIKLLYWKDTKDILTSFSDMFKSGSDDLNWQDFNRLSSVNQDGVYENIAGENYNSLEEVRVAFNKEVTVALNRQAPKTTKTTDSPRTGGVSVGDINLTTITPVPTATPTPTTPPKGDGFGDIQSVQWATEAINDLAKQGVLNGTPEGNFEPQRSITRAEFIKVAMLAFKLDKFDGDTKFKDIYKNDWYYSYVLGAEKSGLIVGGADGTANPNEAISRQDMIVILARAVKIIGKQLPEGGQSASFADIDEVANYAQQSVSKFAELGLVSGVGNGIFAPKDTASRAQVAKVVYDLIKLLK